MTYDEAAIAALGVPRDQVVDVDEGCLARVSEGAQLGSSSSALPIAAAAAIGVWFLVLR